MSQQQQPGAHPDMTPNNSNETQQKEESESRPGLIEQTSEAFVHGAAEEGGKQAAQYTADQLEQNQDDYKEQAQGLWQKYCGCLA